MADQQDKDDAADGRRHGERRLTKTPNYTGPERRKANRRLAERRSEPRE